MHFPLNTPVYSRASAPCAGAPCSGRTYVTHAPAVARLRLASMLSFYRPRTNLSCRYSINLGGFFFPQTILFWEKKKTLKPTTFFFITLYLLGGCRQPCHGSTPPRITQTKIRTSTPNAKSTWKDTQTTPRRSRNATRLRQAPAEPHRALAGRSLLGKFGQKDASRQKEHGK